MLVTTWLSIQDPLADIVISKVPKSIVIILPLLLLLSLILAVSYIIILRKKLNDKLVSCCGVYWDKNLNVYCPSCQKLLGNYAYYNNKPAFRCINCNKVINLSDEEKRFMTLDEAKEKVKRLTSRSN